MTKEKSNWVWQQMIHIKDTPDQINIIRGMFADIQNVMGLSMTATNREIYLAGMDAILSSEDSSDQNQFLLAALEELRRLQRWEAELYQYEKLLNLLGREGFEELCEKHDQDAEELIAQFVRRRSSMKWTDRAWIWLCEYLETGVPIPTSEIKEAAKDAGILDDTKEEWGRMRTLATRKDLTNSGVHGYWQLPEDHRPLVYR